MKEKQNDTALIHKFRKKTGAALYEYSLIAPNDKVLVAVSGGRDSMVLLEILSEKRKHLPFNFDIIAINIKVTNVNNHVETDKMKSFCDSIKIPFILKEVAFEEVVGKTKPICFLCSWTRRKALFQVAGEMNIDKLAFGHHMDDALETLLMNMTYHGKISSIPAKFSMQKGDFDIIRPLIKVSSKEIKDYAKAIGIEDMEGECPNEKTNKRDEFRKIVEQLSQMHKLAKINLFNSMGSYNEEYLPTKKSEET
ncbi:MAG: tRNA lysidine(34) synthetase TilS [Bacteroidota bacterium]|nr:tRNA lysidine(34) synthetase TilS [Bacteroidota bacterium]